MLTDYAIYFCLLWMSNFSIFHFIPRGKKKKKDLFPQTFNIAQHLPPPHSTHRAKLILEISVGLPRFVSDHCTREFRFPSDP